MILGFFGRAVDRQPSAPLAAFYRGGTGAKPCATGVTVARSGCS